MRKVNLKHYLFAIGVFLLASVAGLWSWNTITELFNLPQAQFKHVLAAFLLLLILRWTLFPSHRSVIRLRGGHHGQTGKGVR